MYMHKYSKLGKLRIAKYYYSNARTENSYQLTGILLASFCQLPLLLRKRSKFKKGSNFIFSTIIIIAYNLHTSLLGNLKL